MSTCIHQFNEATVLISAVYTSLLRWIGFSMPKSGRGQNRAALCVPPSHLPDLFSNPAAAYGRL